MRHARSRAMTQLETHVSSSLTTFHTLGQRPRKHHITSLNIPGRINHTFSRPISTNIKALNSLTGEYQVIRPRGLTSPPRGTSASSPEFVAPGVDALTWYICGPTVYDVGHIGHARTYVCFDMINRILTDYFHEPLIVAMGVTDIDDKIIKRANELGVHWLLLARHFEASFLHDLERLGVRIPAVSLRVTEHIPEIVAFVRRIMDAGFAYEAQDGVYFDVKAFADAGYQYGKLQFNDLAAAAKALEDNTAPAVNVDDGGSDVSTSNRPFKRHRADFALWKAAKPDEPSWQSPWGPGRPGWHIECSAMTAAALGSGIDIHAGGVDLRFPHHCNEIAQGEACFGWAGVKDAQNSTTGANASDDVSKTESVVDNDKNAASGRYEEWCGLWLHTGHLHINGCKMSKSLKNFISIGDMLAKGYTADEFRMACAASHYRATMDYTPDKLTQARTLIASVHNFAETLSRAVQESTKSVTNSDAATATAVRAVEREKLAAAFANAMAHKGAATESVEALLQTLRPARMQGDDNALLMAIGACETAIKTALSDDFNVPHVIQALQGLMSSTTKYIQQCSAAGRGVHVGLCEAAQHLVMDTYRILGFTFVNKHLRSQETSSSDAGALRPAVTALADTRAAVKAIAMGSSIKKAEKKAFEAGLAAAATAGVPEDVINVLRAPVEKLSVTHAGLMRVCDDVRDVAMPALGYVLKDTAAATPGATTDAKSTYYLREAHEGEN